MPVRPRVRSAVRLRRPTARGNFSRVTAAACTLLLRAGGSSKLSNSGANVEILQVLDEGNELLKFEKNTYEADKSLKRMYVCRHRDAC